jgi:FixJ family two-component response regulator
MSITIYYLDDEEDLCSIFHDFFSSDTVHIRCFTDCKLAIEAATLRAPDLFFIDYRLPGMNGDEVAHQLADNIAKILVTGDIRINCSANFIQIISKPYDFNLIQQIIDSYNL